MNTNPNAITVLCYGASNTYGQKPDRRGRFAADERWTGILQDKLGGDYYVIEEGLGGRTTNLDHPNPNKPNRNGLTYFKACLESHLPLDFIIIMLGTNDFKTVYNRSVQEIAEALRQFPEYVTALSKAKNLTQPKVILVSPSYMNDQALHFIDSMPTPGIYDKTSVKKSHELAPYVEAVAKETNSLFLDSAPITQTGEDGCHLDKASQATLANALYSIITT
jgi:lysophospholipase L1-like esterase